MYFIGCSLDISLYLSSAVPCKYSHYPPPPSDYSQLNGLLFQSNPAAIGKLRPFAGHFITVSDGLELIRELPCITLSVIFTAVIQSYANKATRDVFDGISSKGARKICPIGLWKLALRKLDHVNQAEILNDVKAPPANRLEKLRGDRQGQYSIRINDQYRICFEWTDRGPENVEIVDYHR